MKYKIIVMQGDSHGEIRVCVIVMDFDLLKVLLFLLKQTGNLLEVACRMLGAIGKDASYFTKCR